VQQTSLSRSTALRPPVPRLTRPPWVDVALAAVFVGLTIAEAVLKPEVTSIARHLVISGVAMASLAFRRQAPIVVAGLVVAAHIIGNPQGELSVILSLVVVSFTVGAEVPPPRSYLGLALTLVPFLTAMAVRGLEPSDLAAALVFLVGPWSVGTAVRQRALRTEEAEARAVRLEAEQAAALQEERTRIARELHDIVSHSISVVTIQTQAVRRRLGPDHQAEVDDLAAVEATAREALAEMRRLFGVLRADGEAASLTPQPGLAELPRLVAQAGSGAVEVFLQVEGERRELPPGLDLAAYRIAQEGITNALRHAAAHRVGVVLRYRPRYLEVEVTDDGRGLSAHAEQGAGHGLVGIRERAALYGGSVDLGALPDGGTRMTARLAVGGAT
jgi:signal transduction histidine kinase